MLFIVIINFSKRGAKYYELTWRILVYASLRSNVKEKYAYFNNKTIIIMLTDSKWDLQLYAIYILIYILYNTTFA